MKLSVVIRSKDEAERLTLTLVSLIGQTRPCEVVVVNDGSSDTTADVLEGVGDQLDLKVVSHAQAQGRSAASNAGALAATGDLLLFLDGDTLLAPDGVEQHLAAHQVGANLIGRGNCRHLRCTRFLRDPQTASPRPGEEDRLARMPETEREALKVTAGQIRSDFAAIDRRSEAGIYPGAGPRRLQEAEFEALADHPDLPVLWATACGSNMSVRREAFLEVGGFDPEIDINEHRELALRLTEAGHRMVGVEAARTYHMTHRSGWRDPLKEQDWERVFWARHPRPEVKLLPIFWASLSASPLLNADERLTSLADLARMAASSEAYDPDPVRARLGLAHLEMPGA